MGLIEVIKNLNSDTMDDDRDVRHGIKELRSAKKYYIKTALVIFIITFIFIALALDSYTEYNDTYRDIEQNYSSTWLENKAYMEVEIQTATINDYTGDMLDTDLGLIHGAKPKSSTVLVFKTLSGELYTIDYLISSNESTCDTFEYVTADFKAPGDSVMLRSEHDRLKYKAFLGVREDLNNLDIIYKIKLITSISLLVILMLNIGIILVINYTDKLVKKKYYNLKIGELTDYNKNKTVKIEKSGIGSEGQVEESTVRSSDDAILGEGGIYKGGG